MTIYPQLRYTQTVKALSVLALLKGTLDKEMVSISPRVVLRATKAARYWLWARLEKTDMKALGDGEKRIELRAGWADFDMLRYGASW